MDGSNPCAFSKIISDVVVVTFVGEEVACFGRDDEDGTVE